MTNVILSENWSYWKWLANILCRYSVLQCDYYDDINEMAVAVIGEKES